MRLRSLLLALALSASLPLLAHARADFNEPGRPLVCDPAVMLSGPRMKKCQDFIQKAMQPDNRDVSCCADADAFIADDFVTKNGKFYAIITENYPSESQYDDSSIKKGTLIEIPKNKFNQASRDGGNPTGHGIVFLLPGTTYVYCYFGPTLS